MEYIYKRLSDGLFTLAPHRFHGLTKEWFDGYTEAELANFGWARYQYIKPVAAWHEYHGDPVIDEEADPLPTYTLPIVEDTVENMKEFGDEIIVESAATKQSQGWEYTFPGETEPVRIHMTHEDFDHVMAVGVAALEYKRRDPSTSEQIVVHTKYSQGHILTVDEALDFLHAMATHVRDLYLSELTSRAIVQGASDRETIIAEVAGWL